MKRTVLILVITAMMSLLIVPVASADGNHPGAFLEYTVGNYLPVSFITLVNTSQSKGYTVTLFNRDESGQNNHTVFTPGQPNRIRPCSQALDMGVLFDTGGNNDVPYFKPFFNVTSADGTPLWQFSLDFRVYTQPEPRGQNAEQQALAITQLCFDAIKNIINFEDPSSYLDTIQGAIDLYNSNQENTYSNSGYAVGVECSPYNPPRAFQLDQGTHSDTVAYELCLNSSGAGDDDLVVQITACSPAAGTSQQSYTRPDDTGRTLSCTQKPLGKILVTFMTYKQWSDAVHSGIGNGAFRNPKQALSSLTAVENQRKNIKASSSKQGGLFQLKTT